MQLRLLLPLALTVGLSATAGVYTSSPGITIPDQNASGAVDSITVSGETAETWAVSVQLNLTGGYNGDLLAYLTYGGQTITLLNRVGTGSGSSYGYADAGLNLTLVDGAANGNIHNYQTGVGYAPLIGNGSAWQPDSGGTTFASTFNGLNPNGTWSLFISDLSGGGQSTLVDWSLGITPVPEPVNVALGLFGVTFGGLAVIRFLLKQRSLHRVNQSACAETL